MNIKAVVRPGITTTAKVTPQQNIQVTNYQVSTSTITLDDLSDVVVGNLQDGALLTYDETSQSWRAQTVIENPNTEINGGFF